MIGGWLPVGALLLDAVIGDPPALYRRLPHPVDLMAATLMALEQRWNSPVVGPAWRRWRGVVAVALCLSGWSALAWALQWAVFVLLPPILAFGVLLLLSGSLLAARGLLDHVLAVERPLRDGDLPAARQALSRIVGRETAEMDAAAVSRAAMESLAENFSDAVVAPLFWLVLLGFPGLVAYKMINTADSLIGHRSDRFLAFGWAAARLDDGANWLPARLTALLLGLARPHRFMAAWRIARAYAPGHLSPNAGWPEAAMAGSLGVKFGGPRRYQGKQVDGAWIGEGRAELTASDIRDAVTLARMAWVWLLLLTGLVTLIPGGVAFSG